MAGESWGSDVPQIADALQKANKNINITNKLLYIVVAENPSRKEKVVFYACQKVDKTANSVDLIGYEISNKNTLKTFDDVLELVAKEKIEIVSISIPWHRIINIKNVSYKPKA